MGLGGIVKIVQWKSIYNFFFNLSTTCHVSNMSHNMFFAEDLKKHFCFLFFIGAKLENKLY